MVIVLIIKETYLFLLSLIPKGLLEVHVTLYLFKYMNGYKMRIVLD